MDSIDKENKDRGLDRLLNVTYAFGSVGVATELLLMEHTEDIWQLIPVLVIAASIPLLIWQGFSPNKGAIKVFQAMMALFAMSGLLGIWLHYQGKAEFKLEIDPELSGWALFWECIHGHSMPPVLAPGTMILLGLLGLATARHRLNRIDRNAASETIEL